jgi:hypothetical protein
MRERLFLTRVWCEVVGKLEIGEEDEEDYIAARKTAVFQRWSTMATTNMARMKPR